VSLKPAGDCKKAVKNAARQIVDQMISGSDAKRKTGRKVPIWAGKIIAAIIKRVGPRGPEFARYAIDMHLIRNYTYVKLNYPQLLSTLIPKYVHRILQEYDFTP
jgi:coenzyme F420 hydrogenase subunit beta